MEFIEENFDVYNLIDLIENYADASFCWGLYSNSDKEKINQKRIALDLQIKIYERLFSCVKTDKKNNKELGENTQ